MITTKELFKQLREEYKIPSTTLLKMTLREARALQQSRIDDIVVTEEMKYFPSITMMASGLLGAWCLNVYLVACTPVIGWRDIFSCCLYPFPGLCSSLIISHWRLASTNIQQTGILSYAEQQADNGKLMVHFHDIMRKIARDHRYTSFVMSDREFSSETRFDVTANSRWTKINTHKNMRTSNTVHICLIPTNQSLILPTNVHIQPSELEDKV